MKKITSFFIFIFLTAFLFLLVPPLAHATTNDDITNYIDSYVKEGLVSLYSGMYNTKDGHSDSVTKWENLVGTNSISLKTDSSNYFNTKAFHLKSTKQYFTTTELNAVNNNEFSLEFLISNFTPLGSSYNTFINSSNDNFALFRRVSSDVLEFKFASVSQASRPTVNDATSFLDNSLISITYKVGGSVKIYINGELKAEKPCSKAMGANDLYFGHSESSRNFEIDYQTFRFYNKELSSDEIITNAKADNMYGVKPKTDHYNTIELFNTNIIGGLSSIQKINNYSDLQEILSKDNLPSAIIYKIDKDLNLILSDKSNVSLLGVLEKCEDKIIPVFNVNDEETVNNLCTFLKDTRYYDSFVMSSDSNLVKIARSKVPNIYGCIDYSDRLNNKEVLTKEDMLSIRQDMHSNNGTVAVIPVKLCTHENIQYLYDSIVNVWSEINSDNDSLYYQAIASGAIGVISPDYEKTIKIAKENFKKYSMTRLPLNIGHRGIPNAAPENTIEGARLAYENGADVIEIDIYQTTDNQVVVMHDASTSRTCNQALNIESCTLAQLKELYVNKGYESDSLYKECRIPTFEEYLKEFKGKDVRIFVEIKSSKESIIPLTKALIDKYDMYDQISFITFKASQIQNLNKYYPGCTTGYLCYNLLDELDSQKDMLDVMKTIGSTNSTLNPSKAGYGANAINAALSRGIGVYPWTFNTKTEYTQYFMNGYSGLTGNDCRMLSGLVKKIDIDYEKKDYYVFDTLTLDAVSTKYNRSKNDINHKININVITEGRDDVIDGNTIQFTKEGKVDLIVSYDYVIDTNNSYTLYSDVISIDVTTKKVDPVDDPVIDNPPVDDPKIIDPTDDPKIIDPTEKPDPAPVDHNKVIITICVCVGGCALILTCVFVIIKKKKK